MQGGWEGSLKRKMYRALKCVTIFHLMTTLIIYISADIFDLEIVQMSRVCVTVGSF